MMQIAIYGKGGAGKTTIAANVAAALAERRGRVLLVGCSPTADSSHLLLGDRVPPLFSSSPENAPLSIGYGGVGCIETGEPSPADACCSRSLSGALRVMKRQRAFVQFAPDFVVYDMPGYNGCIDEQLLAELGADLSLIVTTADFRSLYTVNRFIAALAKPGRLAAPVALVANNSGSSFEDAFVADFASLVKVQLAASIPRSFAVRHSELYGKTVIEAGPLSTHAYAYRGLARQLQDGLLLRHASRGVPLELSQLKAWAHDWGKRLGELEFGILTDGGGI